MPSLKQTKQRIVSVKSTQQITKAMKMVAAAKLRRAQNNMLAARPYSHRLRNVIAEMAGRTDYSHPLLVERAPEQVGFVVVASDRGLAGSFNTNVMKRAVAAYNEHEGADRFLITVGRKATDFFTKRGYNVISKHLDIFPDPTLEKSRRISDNIIAKYYNEMIGLDRVYLVYNEFKNVVQQQIIVEQLLPIIPAEEEKGGFHQDFQFEPSPEAILDVVLPQYINVAIWHVLLESFAAEMAARMTAMENATKAASDMISALTLQYNKARQSAITKELLEIVAGAEALKG
ncbi:MAG: ATP synthase F1 subunit gamma [bacterium]|nr:ATP synthase F1 subunit gamma [bacterium]